MLDIEYPYTKANLSHGPTAEDRRRYANKLHELTANNLVYAHEGPRDADKLHVEMDKGDVRQK